MNTKDNIALLEELKREHEEIHQQIHAWRQWWKELRELGMPRCGEMSERIRQIRRQLEQHFQREDREKVFTVDAAVRPVLAKQACGLQGEHQGLLAHLDRLITELANCHGEQMCWSEARARFEEFLHKLERHECEEHRFLLERLGALPVIPMS